MLLDNGTSLVGVAAFMILLKYFHFVIPTKAGIQLNAFKYLKTLDPEALG